ncbi:MAG TPA: HAMP domain-containing protein, partial [Desulfobacterales bacterium]|nr:HAMP domain-containing protein [Desulfobacterales bacterium]
MKIGTQLRLGMIGIVALVILLGVVAWVQTGELWAQVKGLYDHPMTVRTSIGEIKADILAMHRGLKDLCLALDDHEQQNALQQIETFEADALRHFEIVFDRYLGPRSDVESAYRLFIGWRSIRDETVRILRAGDSEEAIRRTTPSGQGGSHVDTMLMLIGRIADSAGNRGAQFYTDAAALHQAQTVRLVVIIVLFIVVAMGLVTLLLRSIRRPLGILTATSEAFRRGDLDARSGYQASNEFGTLSETFNTLADSIKRDLVLKDQASEIGAGMLKALEARAFGLQVLEPLVRLTGSQVGAVFVLDERRGSYEHVESIGLG